MIRVLHDDQGLAGLRLLLNAHSLDADDELRLRHTEHTGARPIVLDAEIDELGPLFEKTPCHREFLDALDRGQGRDRRQRDHVGE